MNACTLAYVKAWMREAGAGREVDARLEELIPAVSRGVESILGTELEVRRRVEFPPVVLGARTFTLAAHPVRKVSSLRFSFLRQWEANYSELLEGEWWTIDKPSGVINLDSALQTDRQGTYRVDYTAGIATTVEELEETRPEIAQAAAMWVADWFDRGYRISARGSITQGGVTTADRDSKIPKAVLDLLNPTGSVR